MRKRMRSRGTRKNGDLEDGRQKGESGKKEEQGRMRKRMWKKCRNKRKGVLERDGRQKGEKSWKKEEQGRKRQRMWKWRDKRKRGLGGWEEGAEEKKDLWAEYQNSVVLLVLGCSGHCLPPIQDKQGPMRPTVY